MRQYLILAAVAALPLVASAACTDVAPGDYTSCYALRASCHYNVNTGTCVNGAPVICEQFVSDYTGCHTASFNGLGCTIDATGGICRPVNPKTTTCQSAVSTQSQCELHGCFWDQYIDSCWDSITQVAQYFSCPIWLNFDTTGAACVAHLCGYSAGSCTDVGATYQNKGQNSIDVSLSVQYTNIYAIPPNANDSSIQFGFSVVTPLIINDVLPMWGWITLGPYGSLQTEASLPECTTGRNGLAQPVPVDLAHYNTTLQNITAYIVDRINTKHNISWSGMSNSSIAAALLIGNQTNNNFVKNVSIIGDTFNGYSIQYDILFDLSTYINLCNAVGVTLISTAQGYQYTIPVVYNAETYQTGIIQSFDNMYLTITNAGEITISATTPYYTTTTIDQVAVQNYHCPTGQFSMFTSYFVTYNDVIHNDTKIGPRSIGDVYNTSPFNNTIPNCYGDQIGYFNFLGCKNQQCMYYFEFYSACTPLAPDGSTFMTCPSNNAMAGNHDFYVDVYSCPINDPISPNCTSVNPSPTFLTVVHSNILVTAYGGTTINQVYTVQAGILRVPQDTNLADVSLIASSNIANPPPPGGNNQLYANQSMAVVVEMTSTALQAAFDLRLIHESIQIQGLDITGQLLNNSRTLNWTDIKKMITYVPKNEQLNDTSAALLPLVSTQQNQSSWGFDGFSIPLPVLQNALDARGYHVTLPFYFIIHTYGPSTYTGGQRTLLQLMNIEQRTGMTSSAIYILPEPQPVFDTSHGVAVYFIFSMIVTGTVTWTAIVALMTHNYAVKYGEEKKVN
jgi:hypothetical protein